MSGEILRALQIWAAMSGSRTAARVKYAAPTVTRIERSYHPWRYRYLWYGILARAQKWRCDCCRFDLEPTAQLDHDHATGYLRGLVCCSCNTRIGWVERGKRMHLDTTAAKAYVLRWQEHQELKRQAAERAKGPESGS